MQDLINGFYENRAGNTPSVQTNAASQVLRVRGGRLAFERSTVLGDGECGYTALGITRIQAYDKINTHLNEARDLLAPIIKEVLLTEQFVAYLQEKDTASKSLIAAFRAYQIAAEAGGEMDSTITDNLSRNATDLTIIQSYINYDIRDKKVDAGWPHPRVLQVLAHLQGIELYMWQIDGDELIPHRQAEYAAYKLSNATQRTDLLFVNNNHFDILQLREHSNVDANIIQPSRLAPRLLSDGQAQLVSHSLEAQKSSNVVSIGVGVIIKSGNYILLAKRKNSHGDGCWTTPGGHLKIKERVFSCAIRETKEETDIELNQSLIKELGFTEDIFEVEGKHYITCFVCYDVDKSCVTPRWIEQDKFSTEWQWFDRDELPSPLFIPVLNALEKFSDKIFGTPSLSDTQKVRNIWSREFRSGFWGQAATGGTGIFKTPISFQDPVNTVEFSKYAKLEDPVLDFGCGYGRVTNILYQYGYKNIIGIDFSEDMIKRGREEYRHLNDKLLTLSLGYKKLPFHDDSFSAITVFTVLNAIPTQVELENLFNEFRRILKPGGILYIYEFMLTNFEKDVTRYKQFQTDHKDQKHPYGLFKITSGAIIRHFAREDIENLMNGFKILWHDQNNFVSMSGNPCLHGQWISQQEKRSLSL